MVNLQHMELSRKGACGVGPGQGLEITDVKTELYQQYEKNQALNRTYG